MLAESGLISLVAKNDARAHMREEYLKKLSVEERQAFEEREKRSLLEVMVTGIVFALTYFLFLAIFVGGPIVVLTAVAGH